MSLVETTEQTNLVSNADVARSDSVIPICSVFETLCEEIGDVAFPAKLYFAVSKRDTLQSLSCLLQVLYDNPVLTPWFVSPSDKSVWV